jgi:ribonuclease BN (tRNA processing enzyme)
LASRRNVELIEPSEYWYRVAKPLRRAGDKPRLENRNPVAARTIFHAARPHLERNMTTRRKFLLSSTALAAFSEQFVARRTEGSNRAGLVNDHQTTSEDRKARSPWRLHLLGCGYPPPSGTGDQTLVSLAYRFDTAQGSIVFAGDGGDCPELRKLAEGADTLVAPCVLVGSAKRPSYLEGIIMGTDEVAAIAREAGVRRVVLTHNGSATTPAKRGPFIEAVTEAFAGEVLFPDELTTIGLLR